MKLGVFTVLFGDMKFEDMLDKVKSYGIEAIEVGTGGFPGTSHCPIDTLLNDQNELNKYKEAIEKRGLIISALSCHGNPLAPDNAFAKESDDALRKSIELASLLGVKVVNCFSGIPGDSEDAKNPNWPIVSWPNEFGDTYDWQWEHKIIPYWKEIGKLAQEKGVKIAIEMHGGFSIHSPYSLLKLREATCEAIGANLDPSHLWWQGIDAVSAIKILGKANAIHHFHAKDVYLDQDNINMHGLLDMTPYDKIKDRAWTFRTVGYGHDMFEWANIISALMTYGYDYVVSIEHEDGLMSTDEGFSKAVDNLNSVLIKETPTSMWWI